MSSFVEGASVAIGAALFGAFASQVLGEHTDRKQRRRKALQSHFDMLAQSILHPLIDTLHSIQDMYGRLVSMPSDEELPPTEPIAQLSHILELPDLASLRRHFPSQTERIQKLPEEITKHNKDVDAFEENLAESVEQKVGVRVAKGADSTETPNVAKFVIAILRSRLMRRGLDEQEDDYFARTRIEYVNGRWMVLDGQGSTQRTFARLADERQAHMCREVLMENDRSIELRKKGRILEQENRRLVGQCHGLADELQFICTQHERLDQVLKKLSGCRYCDTIS